MRRSRSDGGATISLVPSPNPLLAWIVLGLPVVFVLAALAFFVVRWARLSRPRVDPEALLLGAVSSSLQERGALAASLGELRTVHERILDALPFGLLWVDPQNRVAGFNEEGRRLLGVKQGVVGLDVDFVLEPFPWLLDGLRRVSGEAWRTGDGERRWLLRRIEAPARIGALLQFEDVTEREAEERRRMLRDRFAELGEMTAGVAHQLKNGLAVLKGHAQLLRRSGQEETGRELEEETDALGRVVQRFLQWARPLQPDCRSLDLGEVAAAVLEEVGRRPGGQGLHLELKGSGRALADPQLLQQALLNLVENAAQASPGGATVTMELEEGTLRILDRGPGIPDAELQRLLRPFESGRPDGTGLGLPLALKWLNAQGADLRLRPREGGGTCAEIRW